MAPPSGRSPHPDAVQAPSSPSIPPPWPRPLIIHQLHSRRAAGCTPHCWFVSMDLEPIDLAKPMLLRYEGGRTWGVPHAMPIPDSPPLRWTYPWACRGGSPPPPPSWRLHPPHPLSMHATKRIEWRERERAKDKVRVDGAVTFKLDVVQVKHVYLQVKFSYNPNSKSIFTRSLIISMIL